MKNNNIAYLSTNIGAGLPRFDQTRAVRLKRLVEDIIADIEEREARRIRNREVDYEIKALGLSPKILRRAVMLRDASPEKQREERALLDQYREMIEMFKAEGFSDNLRKNEIIGK